MAREGFYALDAIPDAVVHARFPKPTAETLSVISSDDNLAQDPTMKKRLIRKVRPFPPIESANQELTKIDGF
jgi:hypothetical protein